MGLVLPQLDGGAFTLLEHGTPCEVVLQQGMSVYGFQCELPMRERQASSEQITQPHLTIHPPTRHRTAKSR